MNAREVALLQWLNQNRRRLGLNTGALSLRPVMNPSGGHQTKNYSVLADGTPRLHARLGPAGDATAPWVHAYPVLERRHSVPRLLAAVHQEDLGGHESALIFAHVGGTVPKPAAARELLGAVLAAARALHRDAALQSMLPRAGSVDCGVLFRQVYARRWAADMAEVLQKRELLTFVDPQRLEWLQELAQDVTDAAARVPAFSEPADRLIHGDLHWDNILADGKGFWLVDWEDIRAGGDPVLDYALLVAPFPECVRTMDLSAAERARLSIHLRAVVVDQAIDTLADWLEALGEEPPMGRRAQALSRSRHEAAVSRIRSGGRWPAPQS